MCTAPLGAQSGTHRGGHLVVLDRCRSRYRLVGLHNGPVAHSPLLVYQPTCRLRLSGDDAVLSHIASVYIQPFISARPKRNQGKTVRRIAQSLLLGVCSRQTCAHPHGSR